jgi:glycosyltransferase involved in cell wall biosynthesis
MKVLLLSLYGRRGASSRLRMMQYLPYLGRHGVDVTVSPLLGDEYLKLLYTTGQRSTLAVAHAFVRRLAVLMACGKFDVIWLEKELFPWLPALIERFLGKLQLPVVVDYDDAVFHRYDLNDRQWVRWVLGKKIDRVMSSAALVTAGNGYLAERAIRAGAKQVEIVPTVVDTERYSEAPLSQEGLVTIGWIGTPMTAKYLSFVESALYEVCADGAARVKLVGAGTVSMPEFDTEICEWSEENEVTDIQSFDIGIMPLPDEPWERGKCGYKLIQYMACGKPVVASPVGVNPEIISDGRTGFLASGHNEWVSALRRLISDAGQRAQMGRFARQDVEARYSLSVTAPRVLGWLEEIAG